MPIYHRAFANVNDNVTVTTQGNYDCSKPYVYHIEPYADTIPFHGDAENDVSSIPEYTPMPLHKQHEPKFGLPHGVDASAQSLCRLAFPDSLIDTIVKYTNMYAKVLHDKKNKSFKRVTNAKILAFLAMYYYMGLVKCSSRADYWKKDIN